MTFHVESVTCEWDEDGLHLLVVTDDGDHDLRFPDPDALLTTVSDAVAPWVAEREAARASYVPSEHRHPEGGYDLSDPKHPTYHERMSGLHDNRAGK